MGFNYHYYIGEVWNKSKNKYKNYNIFNTSTYRYISQRYLIVTIYYINKPQYSVKLPLTLII